MSDIEDETEYRIEYTIQRQRPGEDDFTDIGFGSSGGWGDIDAAVYAISSDVQNGNWEREGEMPDPDEVVADIRRARDAAGA